MTITIEASDVQDARKQIYVGSDSWIQIQPRRSPKDSIHSDGPADSFEVKCSNAIPDGSTFSRVLSAKEAIAVVACLIRRQDKSYKAWRAARQRAILADKRKRIKEAEQAVKKAKDRLEQERR